MPGCLRFWPKRDRSRSRGGGTGPRQPLPARVPTPSLRGDSDVEPPGQTVAVSTPSIRGDSNVDRTIETLAVSAPMPRENSGLFVLHCGEPAAAEWSSPDSGPLPLSNVLSSIVAVHGLGGHPYDTWTEEKSGKMWLRDFLPSQVPHTRIMSYGYDSLVAFSKSEIELGDVAADLLNRLDGERGMSEVI